MQGALILAISIHVLTATFWAGSTFALARMGGQNGRQLFGPQMGAALFAIGSGSYLWHMLHEGSFGTTEKLLATGAAAAILALVIQAVMVGGALRRIRKSGTDPRAEARIAIAERVSALLLAITVVAMAASRFA